MSVRPSSVRNTWTNAILPRKIIIRRCGPITRRANPPRSRWYRGVVASLVSSAVFFGARVRGRRGGLGRVERFFGVLHSLERGVDRFVASGLGGSRERLVIANDVGGEIVFQP